MENKNQQIQKISKFIFDDEIVFWTSCEYAEDMEKTLIERFEKIRNENLTVSDSQAIADEIFRIIPQDRKPLFLLKLFTELPKKECPVTSILKKRICEFCRAEYVKTSFDESLLDSIGKTICVSENAEDEVKSFIERSLECLVKAEIPEANALSTIYIWLITKSQEYSRLSFSKVGALIEKCFVERFRTDSDKDFKSFLIARVPRAIVNERYKKEFLGLSYLYLDEHKKMTEAISTASEAAATIEKMVNEKKLQEEKIESLILQKNKLEDTVHELNREIEKLQNDIIAKTDMLEYESNKYQQQYKAKAENLSKELERCIGVELSGIEEVAEHLSEKDRDRISKMIKRIREKASN